MNADGHDVPPLPGSAWGTFAQLDAWLSMRRLQIGLRSNIGLPSASGMEIGSPKTVYLASLFQHGHALASATAPTPSAAIRAVVALWERESADEEVRA